MQIIVNQILNGGYNIIGINYNLNNIASILYEYSLNKSKLPKNYSILNINVFWTLNKGYGK